MRRPGEVEIAAILSVVAGVATLVFGVLAGALFGSGTGILEGPLASLDRFVIGLMGVVAIGFGGGLVIAGAGLWRLRPWARRLTFWLDGIALAGLAYAIATGGPSEGVLAGAVIVGSPALLLLRPGSRAAFDPDVAGSAGSDPRHPR